MIKLSRFKASYCRQRIFSAGAGVAPGVAVPLAVLLAACTCASLFGATKPITLTDRLRSASIEIGSGDLTAGKAILEVDVTDVSNPGLVPIGIAVSMMTGSIKVPIGSFAFFPADHKGNFLLSSKQALARVGHPGNARLVFELQKLRPSAAWGPVRVTITPPKWRSEENE